jgi:hypothetical protein
MSRGLGDMQREILDLYAEAASVLASYPWPTRLTEETQAAMREVREVAHMRQLLCEQYVRGSGDGPPRSVQASFSRALHALIRRGALVQVTMWGKSEGYCLEHVQYVVRVKC